MQQTQICENGNLIRDKLKIENMMIYMNDESNEKRIR